MFCSLCYRRQPRPGDNEDGWQLADWDYRARRPPTCPQCQARALAEHGPGWTARTQAGCYAGGRVCPTFFNPPLLGGELPALDDLIAILGSPKVRCLGDVLFGHRNVIYHPDVAPHLALVFAGERAGMSAVIYHDAAAHLHDRLLHEQHRLALSLPGAAEGALSLMHRKLDDLLWATELKVQQSFLMMHTNLDGSLVAIAAEPPEGWVWVRRSTAGTPAVTETFLTPR